MKIENQDLDYIVITGSTGWLGRTVINELQKVLPKDIFLKKVRAFASKKSIITSSIYTDIVNIPIMPLCELPNFAETNKISAIFHSAFLRREKISSIGLEQYLTINKEISEILLKVMRIWNDAKIVYFSSGVAKKYEGIKDLNSLIKSDPYGILKRKDEIQISEFKNFLILRVYALSGMFLNNPELFALGEFLKCATEGRSIIIKSKIPIIRSYGNAADISRFALNWLMANDEKTFKEPIDSVNLTLDLFQLANKISNLFNSIPVECNWDKNAVPNSYVGNKEEFLKNLCEYDLQPKSLEDQIKDTAKSFFMNN